MAGVVWQTMHYLLGLRAPRLRGLLRRDARAHAVDADGARGRRQLRAGGRVHRRRHAALRPRRPLGLPRPARRRPLLRAEPRSSSRACTSPRPAHQPARRHRAAAGARRDGPARLPRDRPGAAPDRAPRRPPGDDRLPRAALRVLHLRRELRQARLRAAGQRPVPVPPDAAAGGHRLLAAATASRPASAFTTIGNWRQPWREVTLRRRDATAGASTTSS